MINHLIALTIAVVIDAIVGDPPKWPHPVKWMGTFISLLEKRLNKKNSLRIKGAAMVLLIVLTVLTATASIVWLSYQIHVAAGILVESLLIATTIARKSLQEAALEVYKPLQKGDLQEARLKLSYIVGRDTERLGESELVRGTVETVAENTSDGVTAPLFWALIGGAPLAMVYRAINTCDSMVGYKNERFLQFGWASAKLDDLVNWLPSRLSGCMMLMAHKPLLLKRTDAWRIFLRDARKHPSPNSGWLEAAVAVLLGVQLGGVNYYKGLVSNRARMGEAYTPLEKSHILLTNRILTSTTILFILLLWIGGIAIELASTWSKSALYL
ncbi:cobalamin biosynthesis protein [Robertmurraya siralis]|uniref:Cobalamin biosynthesis protein CobD n=1 Tax=Robertmurraya siralis TaxID=77777 RepID=A0A919WKM7_9BACI|nr:adenosylcobinamide-phosphate synthase CbiB [Robertmurraya siralis]PAE19821.1 adenosylcobinamide-phosphate synthase [Bacillus sp. 7504-2]GIN63489.1 cobalamin biosynthesis protein [Robertmurraya siralis]